LIPLVFYINLCLYYLVVENILTASAEITQLRNRSYYDDWWNAETVSEFLNKWVLLINEFSNYYLSFIRLGIRDCLHIITMFIMLFCVFGQELNFKIFGFCLVNLIVVYFAGENKKIQNNYIVHILTISFTPFLIAI
jgi:hypothetical protein